MDKYDWRRSFDYYGFRVIKEPMYIDFMKRCIDITRQDQNKMKKIMKQNLPNRRTALDIGCNHGFFTKFLSDNFDTVHAFDFPNDVMNCCKHNLKDCKNVTVHDHGIGRSNGKVSTNDYSDRHERRAPLGMHVDPTNKGKKHPIRTVDSLNIANVDLIMIDTEGYERHVIEGAAQTIKRDKPMLVVEFHRSPNNQINNLTAKFGYDLQNLQNDIERLGYKSWGYLNKVDQIFLPTK